MEIYVKAACKTFDTKYREYSTEKVLCTKHVNTFIIMKSYDSYQLRTLSSSETFKIIYSYEQVKQKIWKEFTTHVAKSVSVFELVNHADKMFVTKSMTLNLVSQKLLRFITNLLSISTQNGMVCLLHINWNAFPNDLYHHNALLS